MTISSDYFFVFEISKTLLCWSKQSRPFAYLLFLKYPKPDAKAKRNHGTFAYLLFLKYPKHETRSSEQQWTFAYLLFLKYPKPLVEPTVSLYAFAYLLFLKYPKPQIVYIYTVSIIRTFFRFR